MVLEALVMFCVYWTAVQVMVLLAALVVHLAGRRRRTQAARDRLAVAQLLAELGGAGSLPRRFQ